jgi:hypothetical protein
MKTYQINICTRVDLYVSNYGFRFWNKLTTPKKDDFWQWKNWRNSWQSYQQDNIKDKIYTFLDGLPERFKGEEFYQRLTF